MCGCEWAVFAREWPEQREDARESFGGCEKWFRLIGGHEDGDEVCLVQSRQGAKSREWKLVRARIDAGQAERGILCRGFDFGGGVCLCGMK